MSKCIGCKCTDDWACDGGCYWLVVDHSIGKGVCSSCPGKVETFKERYMSKRKKKASGGRRRRA